MPTRSEYGQGTPAWVGVSGPDPAATIEFYTELFGWDADPAPGMPADSWTIFSVEGRAVAGLSPLLPETLPAWMTYLAVEDVEKTGELVVANGGRTLRPPSDVGDLGRTALHHHPATGAFSTWQPGRHVGAELVNEPSAPCWNELFSRDIAQARTFFHNVFGWDFADHAGPGARSYTEVTIDGASVAGMLPTPPNLPVDVPSFWQVYFAVDDCDETLGEIRALGGTVTASPVAVPAGRFAPVADPFGAQFAVIALDEEP